MQTSIKLYTNGCKNIIDLKKVKKPYWLPFEKLKLVKSRIGIFVQTRDKTIQGPRSHGHRIERTYLLPNNSFSKNKKLTSYSHSFVQHRISLISFTSDKE